MFSKISVLTFFTEISGFLSNGVFLMKLQLFVVMREVIGVLNVFMFEILFMNDLVCIHFRVCDRVLSVNCKCKQSL